MYRLEKNHVVEVSRVDKKKYAKNTELQPVEIRNPIPVRAFLDNAEKHRESLGNGSLWRYDPVKANCQYFVGDLLNGNKSDITNTDKLREFYHQGNAGESIKGIEPFAKLVTDAAATYDRVIHGTGLKRTRRTMADMTGRGMTGLKRRRTASTVAASSRRTKRRRDEFFAAV